MWEGSGHIVYIVYCYPWADIPWILKESGLNKPWRTACKQHSLQALFQFLTQGSCLEFRSQLPFTMDWNRSRNPDECLLKLVLVMVFYCSREQTTILSEVDVTYFYLLSKLCSISDCAEERKIKALQERTVCHHLGQHKRLVRILFCRLISTWPLFSNNVYHDCVLSFSKLRSEF